MKEPKLLSPLPRAGEGAPEGRVRELGQEESARVTNSVPSPGAGAPPSPTSGRGETTLRQRARSMRTTPTDAETKLWYRLRDRRFFGLKFKRQKPLAGYIPDFICYEARVVIELDGGQHAHLQREYDVKRGQALAEQGYRVLRFWNDDVLRDIDAVLEAIRLACLSPLPLVGEGGPQDRERGGS